MLKIKTLSLRLFLPTSYFLCFRFMDFGVKLSSLDNLDQYFIKACQKLIVIAINCNYRSVQLLSDLFGALSPLSTNS